MKKARLAVAKPDPSGGKIECSLNGSLFNSHFSY